MNVPTLRRPLTGLLSIKIGAVSDVNHAVTGRLSRGPETFVIMKVEDEFKARTKATKTDRWADEMHQIEIDKGNEVELTVYDRTGSDPPRPVGMLWLRITDINEEMRRKKVEADIKGSGWISADRAMQDGSIQPDSAYGPGGLQHSWTSGNVSQPTGNAGESMTAPVDIDDWFSLEPVGRIHLVISFGESSLRNSISIGRQRL